MEPSIEVTEASRTSECNESREVRGASVGGGRTGREEVAAEESDCMSSVPDA